jgi:4-amino-4-deoxy-L-arabinose transferase-like glycosyltransferase
MKVEQFVTWSVRYRYLILALLGVCLYTAFIGMRDVWYPDEPDIAEVALSMFLSGDWVAPRRMGVVWVDYPPMIYWIGTLSSHLFGEMTAFTLRLPNALTAIGIGLLTAVTASRWFDPKTGLYAGFALMTCLLFVYEANSYRPDVWFALSISAGIILYADGTLGAPRLWLRVAAFACLGIAMLAKGILGLLLPGLVLLLWHASRNEWRRILELAPLSLIALAVFLPWVVGTAQAMGWDNLLHEFYAQNFARFQSGFRGHQQPIYYYLLNFWLDFSPWSWLFPAAIAWIYRSGLFRNARVQLLIWWFSTFLVFLSLAETKRQLYMLPAFPAFALLIGPWLSSVGRVNSTDTLVSLDVPRERPVAVYALALAIAFALLGLTLAILGGFVNTIAPRIDLQGTEAAMAAGLQLPLLILGLLLMVSALWIGMSWRTRDTRGALHRIGLSYVALYAVTLGIVMPAFAMTKTYKPQGQWIRQQIGSEQTHIGMVYPGGGGIRKRGAFGFETGGLMVDLLESESEVESFFAKYPGSLVLVEGNSTDRLFAANPEAWARRKVRDLWVGDTLYVVVKADKNSSGAAQIP